MISFSFAFEYLALVINFPFSQTIHGSYSAATKKNDFAVIELENELDWTDEPSIRPVCLPARNVQSDETVRQKIS